MSDFTKEELEFLYEATRHIGKQGIKLNSDIHLYLLKDKLQSMIENYCEHEERVGKQDDDGHLCVVCKKCDLEFWHEKN